MGRSRPSKAVAPANEEDDYVLDFKSNRINSAVKCYAKSGRSSASLIA